MLMNRKCDFYPIDHLTPSAERPGSKHTEVPLDPRSPAWSSKERILHARGTSQTQHLRPADISWIPAASGTCSALTRDCFGEENATSLRIETMSTLRSSRGIYRLEGYGSSFPRTATREEFAARKGRFLWSSLVGAAPDGHSPLWSHTRASESERQLRHRRTNGREHSFRSAGVLPVFDSITPFPAACQQKYSQAGQM
jgi:hypothetical protein